MKQLDVKALADETILNAPMVDDERFKSAHKALEAHLPAPEPAQPVFALEASHRHGRIAGKSLSIGYKKATGNELDQDIGETAGEALGEVFAAVGMTGNRGIYWGLMLLSMLPVLLVVVSEAVKTAREVKGAE